MLCLPTSASTAALQPLAPAVSDLLSALITFISIKNWDSNELQGRPLWREQAGQLERHGSKSMPQSQRLTDRELQALSSKPRPKNPRKGKPTI